MHRPFWLAVTSCLLLHSAAQAGESPFGWLYDAEVETPGEAEFETQFVAESAQSQGDYLRVRQKLAIEYGVTPRLQLAGYLNNYWVSARANLPDGTSGGPGVEPSGASASRVRHTRFESLALEALYQLRDPDHAPLGIALYLEPEYGPRVRALEWRLILQKELPARHLSLVFNLKGEHERELAADGSVERASSLDLAAGFSRRLNGQLSVGLEADQHWAFAGLAYARREHRDWFAGPNLQWSREGLALNLAWRHQLPLATAFNAEQQRDVSGGRLYGGEHSRDEWLLRLRFEL